MADDYGRPYYDPVRDVMVTPRVSSPTAVQGSGTSQTYATPARQPMYGTYYTPPRPAPYASAAIVQSSPGAVGRASAVVATSADQGHSRPVAASSAQPYYDRSRDVMVTPSQSGTVPYVGSSTRQAGNAAPASTFELVVRNGRLVDGPAAIVVDHGSQVTMVVDSDSPEALRVDGYNLVAPVTAGQPLLLTFVAEQPGRFAYRLGSGREIGVLEVGPPAPMRVGMR
ncbi:hypothetical protein B1810_11975 [Panacagrimonas perspica]|nr:hypothetical protein B1810_11975 [Panacagrimonas perspica]